MLGVERRGRKPIRILKKLSKWLGIGRAAAGLYALGEIFFAIAWALFATVLSFGITVLAVWFARSEVVVEVGGQTASDLKDVAVALVSHIASVRLQDGFGFTGLPETQFSGGAWLTVLLLSLLAVVAGVGVKALSELCKCAWYAFLCTCFTNQASEALEYGGGGWMRSALGIDKGQI